MTDFRNVPWLVLVVVAGCATQPVTRPSAGDTVYPELLRPESWQAGGPVVLGVQLRVQGPDDAEPGLIKYEDVPHEFTPRATIVFWQGTQVLQTLEDIALTPDC